MRTIVSIFIGLALILGFLVYAFWHSARTNSPVPLAPAMFDGYEFTLISDKRYADYLFDGGTVKTTSGQKNGAAIAMGYGWKIKDGNTLVFTDPDIMPAGSGVANLPAEKFSLQFTSFGQTNVVTTAGEEYSRSKFIRPP
jgi:hypothetical protein